MICTPFHRRPAARVPPEDTNSPCYHRRVSPPWTVLPLVEGSGYSSTSTLLTNGSLRVVIDTGLSYDARDLRRALAERAVAPEDVNLVINTHLHVDHCGNNRLFRHARILMSRPEWEWTNAFYTAVFESHAPERVVSQFYPEVGDHQLSTRMIRNVARIARFFWKPEQLGDRDQIAWIEEADLPAGLEMLRTPGHTPHHLSIRVSGSEPQIVAGDAILNESPDAKVRTMIPYSQTQFTATRDALLQLGFRIIPGHGPAFVPRPAAVPHGAA
jgi:N-acyl homoserine lactone hydrolase